MVIKVTPVDIKLQLPEGCDVVKTDRLLPILRRSLFYFCIVESYLLRYLGARRHIGEGLRRFKLQKLLRVLCSYHVLSSHLPTIVATRSKAWIVFLRSNTGIVGSNPTQTHGCLCAFILFVLSCVQVGALRRADPLCKESYLLCKRSRNWKSGQCPTKGCRAIDR
jgi:hypothetical protein